MIDLERIRKMILATMSEYPTITGNTAELAQMLDHLAKNTLNLCEEARDNGWEMGVHLEAPPI